MAGAPLKNKNAATGKHVREAFRYAIAQLGQDMPGDAAAFEKGLRALCIIQFKKAIEGDTHVMQMIADRIDGKPVQGIELTGSDGEELDQSWTVQIVEPKKMKLIE